MTCPSCDRSNRPGARFCGGCGTVLALRCSGCGAANQADAHFCDACGAALGDGAAEKAIARKVVTVVFADLIGSVSLQERLDAESVRRVMDRYHRAMTAAVELHGGRVVQLLGDGVLAAFGVPRVAEDDAVRAVRAGAGMQRAFRELLREQDKALEGVGLRVAVNTGEIVVGDDETAVIGDPANVAARLQQEARDGDVLVGEATQRLVRDQVSLAPLGTFALRGRSESVAAFRLVSLDRPKSSRASAFVGRDAELQRLLAVYDEAVAAPGARLAVLLGSPGLGKSRLVAEFARRAGERATVLSARCEAAGGATFAPLAAALRSLLRIEEGAAGEDLRAAVGAVVSGDEVERARIATGIGALFSGAPSSPEETFYAVRRLLAALAAVRPVVLVIDDVHWAEPMLLDLVEHLAQWSAGVPLFLLVAARPELRDTRSSLARPGPLVTEVVTLGGLDAGASMQLAAGIAGAAELPAALVGRVLATSEGNPLFLSELVRMLLQDGTLRLEGGRWVTTVEIAALEMPPTIQVLLAARIERLRPEDRAVLERAAVVGRHFSRAAIAHLLPVTVDLDARLESLRRSELIEADTGWLLGEPALRFHHVLIRDAAYRRILKETRAELHERLADWIVARAGESIEHDETIGWHLEQAHENLRELEVPGRGLGERAARYLGAAGRRALARDDLALAAALLERALRQLGPGEPARAELTLDWCEALLAAGEVGPAATAVADLERLAAGSERLRAWYACFAGQLAALTDPRSLRETAAAAARAAEALAAAGDAAGEAKALSVHAGALARLGEIGACETALDHALAAARRARDRRRSNAVLAVAPLAALWGPSPVSRASGRCLDVVRVLRITQGAPAVEAVALRCQAVLETLRGRSEAAHRMLAASRAMVEELGIAQQILEADVFAGIVDLLEGDAAAAETALRRAYEGLRDRGLQIDAARAAALLGRALLAGDRVAEAEALSHESAALAGNDLKAAIAWRGVRAEALARRGEAAAGIELAREAVAIASATDALLDHADARLALATALRAAGRTAEADDEAARTAALWAAKGADLLLDRARGTAGASEPRAELGRAADTAPRRPVRPNFATEHGRRLDAALAAGDPAALETIFSESLETIHHPTGTGYGRNATIERFAVAMKAGEQMAVAHVPLATLGDGLGLFRVRLVADGFALGDISVGAVDVPMAVLIEADAGARALRVEIFAGERLAAAVARLYERHAELLLEGPEREAAATTARCVAALMRSDFDAVPALSTDDCEQRDRRRLGLASGRGRRLMEGFVRASAELFEDLSAQVEDVLALVPNGYVVRLLLSGRARSGGGRFESPRIEIRRFGADGRQYLLEIFDLEDEAAALARFDALEGVPSPDGSVRRAAPSVVATGRGGLAGAPAQPVANAATRSEDAMLAAWRARDWDAVAAIFAPGFRSIDRRSMMHVETDREGLLHSFRPIFEMSTSRESTLLATRGEHLALHRVRFSGSDDLTGPSEVELLQVIETDAAGHRLAAVAFDVADLAAAQAELEARAAAPATAEPRVREDGSAAGAAAGTESAPGAGGAGSPGRRGEPQAPAVVVPDALARWLRPNAAVRARDRLEAAVAARDWPAASAAFAAGARIVERQGDGMRLDLDAEAAVVALRDEAAPAAEPGSERHLFAVLGGRVALEQKVRRGASPSAAVEVEKLALIVSDEEGRLALLAWFEPSDVDAAYREACAHWASFEPELGPLLQLDLALGDAITTRDAHALRALLADDLMVDDRRRTGFGALRGADALVTSFQAVWGLTQTASGVMRARLAVESWGWVSIRHVSGALLDGGSFESLDGALLLMAEGRVQQLEYFELGEIEDAMARFESLRAQREGSLGRRVRPNAAARAAAAMAAPFAARAWENLRGLAGAEFVFEDRRRQALFGGDVEAWLHNLRLVSEWQALKSATELCDVRGDRLALQRLRYAGGDGGSDFEGEFYRLIEVDAGGLLRAILHFDTSDLEAALAEMQRRFEASDDAVAAGRRRS